MSEEPNVAGGAGDVDPVVSELAVGRASGGPLDGGEITCRRPAGVLLVDRPAGRVWRYEKRMGDLFVCLDGDQGRDLVDDEGAADNRYRAAEEGLWDVQAAPWVGGDPDAVDVDQPDADVVDDDQGDDVPAELGDEVTGPIDETEV